MIINYPLQNRASTDSPADLTSLHILVMEKNMGIAEMITIVLAQVGYCSTICTGELSALSQLSTNVPPALILLDLSLLREPSRKVLSDRQREYCTTTGLTLPPLIVLTTSPKIKDEVETMGYRTLLKPFRIRELLEAVRESLHGSSSQDEALLR
jgi:DNA-binding response OmpR family regulator